MTFRGLCGNNAIKKALSSLTSKTFPHAAVIEGEEGSEKEKLGRLIASAVVCRADDSPCGVCSDCKKSALGLHPDILWLGEEAELKVDDVRAIRRNAYIRPNEAERKVFVIENADKMNVNAQNAMLNILEEPPSPVVFLLLCENRELLLPTVLSRCAVFSVDPPGKTEAEKNQLVRGFVHALACPSEFAFLAHCMAFDTLKREEFSDFFVALSKAARDAIAAKTDERSFSEAAKELRQAFSQSQLLKLYDMAQELLDGTQFNASNAALIAGIVSKSRKIKS